MLESNHDVEMLKCGTYPYPLKRRILGEYGHLSNETASKSRSAPCTERHRTHYARSFKQRKQPSGNSYARNIQFTFTVGVDVGKDMTLQVADRYKPTLF